jgi:hypothetical protein
MIKVQVLLQDTVKGKVSSLNSLRTTPQQIVRNGGGGLCDSSSSTYNCSVVDSPDLDGSYGKNPEGIFFFNAEGAYREYAGRYMVSDQPFSTNTPITLTRQL